tara:strand:+ start:1741 stop:2196 length:456 start_codon:yes stop_codon:yes gene_type:complete
MDNWDGEMLDLGQCTKADTNFDKMLSLGGYHFSVDTAAYQSLTTEFNYNWASQACLGTHPRLQFTGLGAIKKSLTGEIYPFYRGGFDQVQLMALEAEQGLPLKLITATGLNLDFWCITHIQEESTEFMLGGLPKKMTFQLELLYYGQQGVM